MQFEDYSEYEHYTGDLWAVVESLYNAADPEYNDGTFEEHLFDSEDEAIECYDEIVETKDFDSILANEPDPYYDEIAVLLCCSPYVNGYCDTLFTNDIVKGEVVASQ